MFTKVVIFPFKSPFEAVTMEQSKRCAVINVANFAELIVQLFDISLKAVTMNTKAVQRALTSRK